MPGLTPIDNGMMPTPTNLNTAPAVNAPIPNNTAFNIRPELTYGPPLRFYFAYGSNMSLTQMSRRCPTAVHVSLGILRNHTWKIGPRGYANVISSSVSFSSTGQIQKWAGAQKPVVYGMLYTIQAEDEEALDIAEGVPFSYEKRDLFVEVLSLADTATGEVRVGQMVKALVYVDVQRMGDGICKEEYVVRMNRSIRDAKKMGMPEWYIRDVMRKDVREEEIPSEDIMPDPFHPGILY